MTFEVRCSPGSIKIILNYPSVTFFKLRVSDFYSDVEANNKEIKIGPDTETGPHSNFFVKPVELKIAMRGDAFGLGLN